MLTSTPDVIVKTSASVKRVRSVRPANEFRRVVLGERARSNRSGLTFCVLVFEAGDRKRGEDVALDQIARILCQRLRDTDEVGWLSSRQIAAVLPYTQKADAKQLGMLIRDQLPAEFPRPTFKVLVHPPNPDELIGDDQGEDDDPSEQSNGSSGGRGSSLVHPVASRANGDPSADGPDMGLWFALAIPPWKRMMDVVLSAVALFLLSPLMVLIAISIKLMSSGPVMFKQRRTGLGGRVFEMHKFRTMTVTAEADQKALLAQSEQDGPAFKMKHDPRITGIGRILRKTSLDELPQLWNVLKGEMSLVGPRPLPCHEADACIPWQNRRLDITPGITCIWQTEGRSRVTFDEWMRMDIEYIRTRSITRDLSLLFRTVWAIASCRGAQ